jgi:hypothetical protein
MFMKLPETSGWRPKQQFAAIALAGGATLAETARQVEISELQIYTWMCNKEFKAYVDKLRAAMLNEALGMLTKAATEAARTMVELLGDSESSVRLRASQAIFDTIEKLREHIEFDGRIAALEARDEPEIEDFEVGEDDDPANDSANAFDD